MKTILLLGCLAIIPFTIANAEDPLEITITSCEDFNIVKDSGTVGPDGNSLLTSIYPLSERGGDVVSQSRNRNTEIADYGYLGRIDLSGLDSEPSRAIQTIGSQIKSSLSIRLGSMFNSNTSKIAPHQILLLVGERITITVVLAKVESEDNDHLFDVITTVVKDKLTDTDPE